MLLETSQDETDDMEMNPCQSQLSACHHLALWPWDVVYRAITALLLKLVLKLSISRTISTDAERCAVQLDTFICGDQIVGVLSTDKTRLSSFLHPFIFWDSNNQIQTSFSSCKSECSFMINFWSVIYNFSCLTFKTL